MVKKIITLVILSITSTLSIFPQVTIGNDEKPVAGALLQLSNLIGYGQGEANSTKGLLLPRVSITDPTSIEMLDGALQIDAEKYTGITVYNTTGTNNVCYTIPQGLLVWDGEKWNAVGDKKIEINGIPPIGSLQDDLIVLKAINDTNSGNNLGTGWSSIVVTDTDPIIEGCTFGDACGQQRLIGLSLTRKVINSLDISKLNALQSLILNNLPTVTFSGANLNLKYKPLLQKLVLYDIYGANLSGIDLNLTNHPNLTSLELVLLPNATFNDTDLDLKNKPKLQSLNLSYIPDANLATLNLKNNPKIEELIIENLTNASFSSTDLDLKNKPKLHILTLSSIPNTTLNGMDLNLKYNNELQSLDIIHLANATFISSDLGLKYNTSLQRLALVNLPNVTLNTVDLGLANKFNLEYLQLADLPNANFSGADLDLKYSIKLQTLHFTNLSNVTFTSTSQLNLMANTKLSYLFLTNSNFENNSVKILDTTLNAIMFPRPSAEDPIYDIQY